MHILINYLNSDIENKHNNGEGKNRKRSVGRERITIRRQKRNESRKTGKLIVIIGHCPC